MKGWQFYRTKDVGIFPYMPGVPVYRDGMLPFLYTKLKEEGKVAMTFCGDNKTMDEFVSYFHRLKTMQVLCEIGDLHDPANPQLGNILKPVGFSWVDNVRGREGCIAAGPGEAYFDDASKRSSARDLARLGLAYYFEDLKINVLHGVQLVTHTAAKNFAMKMGFKEDAIVHDYHEVNGRLVDARIMILRDHEYMPGFWEWKAQKDLEGSGDNPVDAVA